MIIWLLYTLIIVFNILDGYQTFLLFQYGHTEANPLLNYFINQLGYIRAVIIVKGFWLLILGVLLFKYKEEK